MNRSKHLSSERLVIVFLLFVIGLLLCLLMKPEETCTRDHRVEPSHMAEPTLDGKPKADTQDHGAKV